MNDTQLLKTFLTRFGCKQVSVEKKRNGWHFRATHSKRKLKGHLGETLEKALDRVCLAQREDWKGF